MNRITDFHTHIFPPCLREDRARWVERDATFGELYADPRAQSASAEDLIAAMDEDGVGRAVVMGMGWTEPSLAREANDYLIESQRRYPERISAFCSVNPAWGEAAAKEIDRCARAGLIGVGELHPDTQGFDLGDERILRPTLEAANEHGMIITTHSSEPVGHAYPGKGRTTPDTLLRFIETAQSYESVRIVCAHWGGGLPFYALMPEVRESLSKVWFDTAATPFLYTPEVFAVAANLIGIDKILPASDFPLLRFRRIRQQAEQAGSKMDDFTGAGQLLGITR